MDHVQMRNGTAFVGEVTNREIHLRLAIADRPIAIGTDRIVWIIFRNPSGFPQDRVQLKDGSELSGTVVEDALDFKSEALGKLRIPTRDILAAQLLTTFGT
jgi:hypothetical protein